MLLTLTYIVCIISNWSTTVTDKLLVGQSFQATDKSCSGPGVVCDVLFGCEGVFLISEWPKLMANKAFDTISIASSVSSYRGNGSSVYDFLSEENASKWKEWLQPGLRKVRCSAMVTDNYVCLVFNYSRTTLSLRHPVLSHLKCMLDSITLPLKWGLPVN